VRGGDRTSGKIGREGYGELKRQRSNSGDNNGINDEGNEQNETVVPTEDAAAEEIDAGEDQLLAFLNAQG
jgi:hypothetical protein